MSEHSVAQHLNIEDLSILLEAMEAWENKDVAGEMMSELLMSALSRNDRDDRDKSRDKAEREQRQMKHDDDRRLRKERSVLIRAKLIQLKDEARVASVTLDSFRRERLP